MSENTTLHKTYFLTSTCWKWILFSLTLRPPSPSPIDSKVKEEGSLVPKEGGSPSGHDTKKCDSHNITG